MCFNLRIGVTIEEHLEMGRQIETLESPIESSCSTCRASE